MIKEIILLFFTFNFITYAQTKVTVATYDGRTTLRADDCKIINKQISAIEGWKSALKEELNGQSTPSCTCSDGMCFADVTNFLPEVIADVNNKKAKFDGPNCWNASLVSSKILPHMRYTSGEEMNFWMNSDLCKKIYADEKPRPGDVITIRKDGKEYHGFIYISDEIVFTKNGYSKTSKYQIQDIDKVYEIYGVDKTKCRHINNEPTPFFSGLFGGCSSSLYSEMYRCKSWDEFVKNKKLDEKGLKVLDEITSVECDLEKSAFNGQYDKDVLRVTKETMVILKYFANEKIKNLENDPINVISNGEEIGENLEDDITLWKGIKYRAEGIVQHLYTSFRIY